MRSSTSNSDRAIPDLPWTWVALIAALLVGIATAAWEIHCRAIGYAPTLNNTEDLWAQWRRAVKPGSVVIIGDSRAWFDLDLDELEKGLGQRPVQLALPGSCAYPILNDLASDEHFRGTVICSVVPGLFFAPAGPPISVSEKALHRYRTWSPSQRSGHYLAMPLEEHFAFLKQDELNLGALLKQLPIDDRPSFHGPPTLPPYFETVDRDRRARMIAQCAEPGELQSRIQQIWPPLFTPPPPPPGVPKDVFMANMGKAMAARMQDAAAAVAKIRARGGKVVFVRFPMSGGLKVLEDKITPRTQLWDGLLKSTAAPGIYFEDYPELASFNCPEWSHLSASDSVEFTKRLLPHLRAALSGISSW